MNFWKIFKKRRIQAQKTAETTIAAPQPTMMMPVPQTAAFTLHLLDARSGAAIAAPQTQHVFAGAELTIPELAHYVWVKTLKEKPLSADQPQDIYLFYTRLPAAPVILSHRDQNGNLLDQPQYLFGDFGDAFQVNPLKQYADQEIRVTRPANGYFSDFVQPITFYYQIGPDEQVVHDYQVKIRKTSPVFRQPGQPETKLPTKVYAGTLWRVYHSCRFDHRLWFDLGSMWIESADTQSYRTAPTQPRLPEPHYQVKKRQKRSTFTNWVANQPTLWSAPYGDVLPAQDLPRPLRIHQIVQLDNNSIWAQLGDHIWVERKYLKS
ncbi:MucBP domain-containing protein [Lactobacillus selangorensis]|nr:MucBP domain-containing protein [Lactobacillus selangorensis]